MLTSRPTHPPIHLQAALEQYDLVIVADTTPIARPLLQHGWPGAGSHTRLLLWVCNRFDYGVVGDVQYYALLRAAAANPRVTLVSYTPLENSYAREVRGVEWGSAALLRPIGLFEDSAGPVSASAARLEAAPRGAERGRSFFVAPKVNEAQLGLAAALGALGVPVWTPGTWPHTAARWAGATCDARCAAAVVASFRATIHVPYAPSTFALFEQAQAGRLTFVPSVQLMLQWAEHEHLFFQATPTDFVSTGRGTAPLSRQHLEATEYYDPLNAALFVYFDSLEHLQRKLAETDYAAREAQLRAWAERHTNTTLQRWQTLGKFLIGAARREP